jgi:hypothetical protein
MKRQSDYRAIVTGKIVTVKDGKRTVEYYRSGDKLKGEIPVNDAPPFTGYVRGWFSKKGKR